MGKLIGLIAALLLVLTGARGTLAQETTPRAGAGATFADTLGLPELAITAPGKGFDGVPDTTAAGRYVVTFTNTAPDEIDLNFMQLPDGVTVADLAEPPPGAGGTPVAGGAEEDQAPEWFYHTYIAGGVSVQAGQTGQAIVDLKLGTSATWAGDPSVPLTPVELTVTGDMPADVAEPAADVTINEVGTADGFAFRLDGALAAGQQTVRVYNHSDQPHFVFLVKAPGPITEEQVQALVTFDPSSGTPLPAGTPKQEDFVPISSLSTMSTMSIGATAWFATNLEPGYYVMLCFVGDPDHGGMPHAAEGMAQIVEVK
jgi:hypothetical protein